MELTDAELKYILEYMEDRTLVRCADCDAVIDVDDDNEGEDPVVSVEILEDGETIITRCVDCDPFDESE